MYAKDKTKDCVIILAHIQQLFQAQPVIGSIILINSFVLIMHPKLNQNQYKKWKNRRFNKEYPP